MSCTCIYISIENKKFIVYKKYQIRYKYILLMEIIRKELGSHDISHFPTLFFHNFTLFSPAKFVPLHREFKLDFLSFFSFFLVEVITSGRIQRTKDLK